MILIFAFPLALLWFTLVGAVMLIGLFLWATWWVLAAVIAALIVVWDFLTIVARGVRIGHRRAKEIRSQQEVPK